MLSTAEAFVRYCLVRGVHAGPGPDHRKIMAVCGLEAKSDRHLTQDLCGVIVQILVVVVLHN